MFSTNDTIVAIATAPGRGGIGVVRLSGARAPHIARQLTQHDASFAARHATLTTVHAGDRRIDHVIVTCFPAPSSYTGEDVAEISAHGSPVILNAIVTAALEAGARLAAPGEFTLRAFLNGRIDLTQAEAVADLIDAVTPTQARVAFDQLNGTLTSELTAIDRELFDLIAKLEASVDFPDEGYHFLEPGALAAAIDGIRARTRALIRDGRRGRLLREGLTIAIVGEPNVGKSSVFNALVGSARAIVTDVPGTTRDLVSETIDLEGLRVTVVDTAGLRETDDPVEREGVSRSRGAIAIASVVLHVVDRSLPRQRTGAHDRAVKHDRQILVANKSDLPACWSDPSAIDVSALTGDGIETLRAGILEALDFDPLADHPTLTNIRHIELLSRADTALERARSAAFDDGYTMSEEFVLADLQDARAALEEVTGRRSPDAVLAHIFERFCIGK